MGCDPITCCFVYETQRGKRVAKRKREGETERDRERERGGGGRNKERGVAEIDRGSRRESGKERERER